MWSNGTKFTPLTSAAVIGEMFNAVGGVQWHAGIWAQNGGYELALLFGVAAVAIAGACPGRLSLDRHRAWATGGALRALFAIALAGAVSVMALKAL